VAILVSLVLACAAVPALAGDTVSVEVGRESAMVSFDAMFPAVTYIHVGDTITFTSKASATPHTVTFAPGTLMPALTDPGAMAASQKSGGTWAGDRLLNSGIIRPGDSYTVTFTKEGVFDYACILHPLMGGQITVLPAGVPIPRFTDQKVMGDMNHHDHTIQADLAIANQTGRLPEGTVNSNGSVTWKVHAGLGLQNFSVNQFFPKNLVISEGDTVVFRNDNIYDFHFVTFPTSPADRDRFYGPQGANLAAMMTPMGGSVVDGSQLINSGGIFPEQSKSFSFPKAGIYKYICYIHDGNHMEGTVIVQLKDTVHAYVNGQPIVTADTRAPHMLGSHVHIPLRAVVEALNGSIAWDGPSQTVSIVFGPGKAEATAAEGPGMKLMINGKLVQFDTTPGIHQHTEGRSYVPALQLMNLLGGQMQWDAATKTLVMEVHG
jgi:plastocyanin